MGIIDTLSAGFGIVNRRPWVLGVPILLDLFLWLGPRLSADPIMARLLEAYQQLSPPGEGREQLTEVGQQLQGSNVFTVLAWQLPSIVTSRAVAPAGEAAVFSVQSWAPLLGVMLVLAAVGLVGTCLYLGPIAQSVRGESFELATYLDNTWGNFRRLAAYFLLVIGFLVVFGMPLAVTIALVGLASPALAGILSFLGVTALLWLFLYLFFANYAIFVGGRSPLRAIWESMNLVARHFWSALAMFLLVHLILLGTAILWGKILAHPAGVLVAILGNAYIASGLAAAAMVFYREKTTLVEGNKAIRQT